MKLFKRLFALFITVFIIASASFSSFASNTTNRFKDVNDDTPGKEYILNMAERGIIKGKSHEYFVPNDTCTREQFITFLWRAAGSPQCQSEKSLTDIGGDEYSAQAIMWAYENGITKIYSDDSFGRSIATDREHAVYFLYNWAKLLEKSDIKTIILLDSYSDRAEISIDSRLPFAWAMAEDLITACDDGTLSPKAPVTRAWAAQAIGKLLDSHLCKWSAYIDNGDGTHKRVCEDNVEHIESGEHEWNNGELTIRPTKDTDGEITYTCTCCLATKKEKANAGEVITTRADIEEALVSVALAYEVKGNKMQYDSTEFTDLHYYYGGLDRLTTESAPEYATEDTTFYSVCSDYVHQCFVEAINRRVFEHPSIKYAPSVYTMFRYSDNQLQSQYIANKVVEPITDEDIDACILRWMNFDKYTKASKTYADRIQHYIASGLFESGSFTDFTTGLTFKDDGYEGTVHYSYYDSEGNLLTPNEAREKYLYPYLENFEENLRPGDVIASQHHAMIYMGNKRILDCNGAKIDTTTGEDKIEAEGSIVSAMIIPEPFNWKSTSAISLTRPLEFLVKEGYDDDPGNDIVKDLVVPEKTKSRIKYPAMDIDRTVDITPFGTAVKNDTLTYTVKISNKTDRTFYKEWLAGPDNIKTEEVIYENIPVTELIPDGCEFVEGSVTPGGKYENKKITWNIEKLAPGETVSLSYTVKVTAEVGSVIVSDGGMVDNIPSNSISNTVGKEKLDITSQKLLSDIALSGNNELVNLGSDTDFAEAVYKTIGKDLTLPTVKEISEELFKITDHVPGDIGIYNTIRTTPIKLFAKQDTVSSEYSDVKSMLIDKFWGGRRFFVGENEKWNPARNCIKEFRSEYLEAGDIIIYAKAKDKENLSHDFDVVTVMVYDGNKLLSAKKTANETIYEIFDEANIVTELNKLYTVDKDLFFALRPSQLDK